MNILPAAFSLAASLLVMASLWSWAFALKKLILRQPLLVYEPRRTPPWNLIDLCLVFAIWVSLQFLVATWLGGVLAAGNDVASGAAAEAPVVSPLDSVSTRWVIVVSGMANLLACGLGGLLIVLRTGARWGQDLGLTLRQAGRDIACGVVAFAMMAPIIYTIQLILVQWYPSEHPLIESFRANPTWGFYLVCVFAAAIVAPLFEEFFCRVLLQGLLERILVSTSVEQGLFATLPPDVPPSELFSPGDSNPYAPSTATPVVEELELTGHQSLPAEPLAWRQGAIPILISSLVFAGLHWSHGPDPIPLFVLALGLGYLYQRTHRILPCVVVHFLVNALALAMLAMSLSAA